jgi:hypothetical protein
LISISMSLLVGDVSLGQKHVHVPGHAAGHRVDGVLDVDAHALELVGQMRTACCAWATAMP